MLNEEYEPLVGSASAPKKHQAFFYGGAGFLLVACLFLFAGPGNQIQPVVTQTMAVAEGSAEAPVIAAAVEGETYSAFQWNLVYNFLSLGIAAQGSATIFFFFQFSLVAKEFRTAMTITGLVTLIAFYHYMRIFNSFTSAFVLDDGVVTATGIPFNDAYRYVDWLLTVPLLLMELILVMQLSPEETANQCSKLGISAALMIVLGYPGEISDDASTRWLFWALAMVPFIFIVYSLFSGLNENLEQQGAARDLVDSARWITVISWCTYPIVFVFPMIGLTGSSAKAAVQVGYSIADVVAKPIMGILCWKIASLKSRGKGRY